MSESLTLFRLPSTLLPRLTNEQRHRHMQRINQKSQFNNSDSIQHHANTSTSSLLSDTSSHENVNENESEREYLMQRSRQKRRVGSNYSRRYSHSSNYTSCEESWTWHPRKRKSPDSRHSTTHFIGRTGRTDKYDEEWQWQWQPRTCTRKRKQPPHTCSYDSTTPVTPPQHTIHDGQLRNGSFSILCEEPEPTCNQYHMDRSYETKHHHRAQNKTHTDRAALDRKYSIKGVKARTTNDGSVMPVNQPKMLKNGLFMRPAGRQRKGMDWDSRNGVWVPQGTFPGCTFDERIKALRSYKRAHGNLHVPTDICSPTCTLGIWLLQARRDLERIELGKEPIYVNVSPSHYWKWEVLKSILVMDAEPYRGRATATATARGVTFDELVEALRKYKHTHGNLDIQTDKSLQATSTLGIWLMKARADLELLELGYEQQYFFPSDAGKWDILKELGVADATISMHMKPQNRKKKRKRIVKRVRANKVPDHYSTNFYNHGDFFNYRLQELKRFKKENGHFNVPICGDLYMSLGIWCRAVKRAVLDLQEGGSKRTPKPVAILGAEMNTERLQILAKIGFISGNMYFI